MHMVGLENGLIPFTFIPGVGMLVLSTANRLYNVSNLIREIVHSRHHLHEGDLSTLVKRTQLFHRALICFYAAIGLLACAALIGSLDMDITITGFSVVNFFTSFGIIFVVVGSVYLIYESIITSQLIIDCEKTRERMRAKSE